MTRVIYEPKGPALEYAQLAVNLFRGCRHRCSYCYVPGTVRMERPDFHRECVPRSLILGKLEQDAAEMAGDPREILLCFTSDPYHIPQRGESRELVEQRRIITRRALEILYAHNLKATVLTKAGSQAMRDFNLLKEAGFSFGTSLVWKDDEKRRKFEPYADDVISRAHAIKEAHARGIRTWVSLEPVIDTSEALAVVEWLNPWVDHWKVGKINHSKKLAAQSKWGEFRLNILGVFKRLNADYVIKKSLMKA